MARLYVFITNTNENIPFFGKMRIFAEYVEENHVRNFQITSP